MTNGVDQFKQLRQADLHSIVARQAIGESVKLTVLLHGWVSHEPYPAYYGMVDLQDIETCEHLDRLSILVIFAVLRAARTSMKDRQDGSIRT